MTTLNRRALAPLLVVALSFALAGCPGKRRPALAAPGEGAGGPGAFDATASTQPVGETPEMWPAEGETPTASDIPFGLSGEDGPFADIHFDLDAATLSAEARSILDRHAAWLRDHPEVLVVVEGHCDDRGTVEYNLALGEQRARVTLDYLVGLGLAPARLRSVSYGKERPLDTSQTEEAYARNRRAHLAFDRRAAAAATP